MKMMDFRIFEGEIIKEYWCLENENLLNWDLIYEWAIKCKYLEKLNIFFVNFLFFFIFIINIFVFFFCKYSFENLITKKCKLHFLFCEKSVKPLCAQQVASWAFCVWIFAKKLRRKKSCVILQEKVKLKNKQKVQNWMQIWSRQKEREKKSKTSCANLRLHCWF